MPTRWCLVLAVSVLVLANVLSNRLLPDLDVELGLALTAAMLGIARLGGLTMVDLGLARPTWGSGLRWGLAAAGLIVAGYAVALLIGPLRESLARSEHDTAAQALLSGLVVIPLGTVIAEEVSFRGVLWGLLRRAHGTKTATVASSALFGVWHVLPSLGTGPANQAVVDAVGNGAAGTALRVAGTVAFTFAAGVVFCELRRRSDSLLAPILLHWAVNGVGVAVVLLA